MLIQFSVENFKSFKDRAVLSLEASSDKEMPENLAENGKKKYLKVISIFGANAAGKSNIFHALTAAIALIRQSNNMQIGEPLSLIVPFKFDEKKAGEPSSFEFVFITHGEKYVYGFSATRKRITEEYLYVYHTSRASTVFERTGDDYTFTSPKIKREMEPLTKRNTSNKLFLATATQWNCDETQIPFLWFTQEINTYPADTDELFRSIVPMFENDKDGSLKRFTMDFLHEADINIDDFEFESRETKPVRIETIHTVEDASGKKQYKLPFGEESQGTKHLFLLAPILNKAFETGETVCIDEFDMSIHTLLVEYLIGLFNDPEINANNAQLILSTHSVSLMSLKILRRDQIYFVEKDEKTGASELYSLDEFSPRKHEDVRKAYLLGRYGAIPNIPEA